MSVSVSVENISVLERKLTVSLPSEIIADEVKKRLTELSAKAKIDGFRPGKVPFSVIQKRFEKAVLAEVLEDKIKESYLEALQQEKLDPATYPKIDVVAPYEVGKLFQYNAIIELFPEVRIEGLDQIEIPKKIAGVTPQDVENMLEIIRKQFAVWEETSDPSQDGYRVTIDYEATVGGQAVDGSKNQDQTFTLGAPNLFHDFAKNLLNVKTGDELKFKVTYPADYPHKGFANNEVDFVVQVKKVARPELPVVDEDFTIKMGVKTGGVDKLHTEIKNNMQRTVDSVTQKEFRKAVFDALVEKYPLELPPNLVNREIERLRQIDTEQKKRNAAYMGIDVNKLPLASDEELQKQARYELNLALLMRDLIKSLEITVNEENVRKKIMEQASTYENPEEAMNYYYKKPEYLEQIRNLVLDDQVLEALEKKIKVVPRLVEYKDVIPAL